MIKNIKKAFTLAEVLMTIAIIGVVATLTIPNLGNSINEDKYITLLRSTVSQLDGAFGKLLADYGTSEAIAKSCTGSINDVCFGDKLTSYLELRLNCKATKDGKCFTTGPMYDIDGSKVTDAGTNASSDCEYMFVLQNGVSVCMMINNASDLDIDIDLDGPNKGPNRRGYDCFRLATWDDGPIHPRMGAQGRIKSDGSIKNFDYDEYTEWAFSIGNMDYLRCADDLNWITKHSCD